MPTIHVSNRERDALLAALRLLQIWLEKPRRTAREKAEFDAMLADIHTNGQKHEGLSSDHVDSLAERINK